MRQWRVCVGSGTVIPMVVEPQSLDSLNEAQLRAMLHSVLQAAAAKDQALAFKQAVIDKLTHENALLKRMKFAAQSERYSADQKSLLEDEIETDLAAVAEELNQHRSPAAQSEEKQSPKRQSLPAHLPRREIRHEPESSTCRCGCQLKRIGEDVAEKLDYVPSVFTVERHIRGKWACAQCETIIQAPVAAHIIDKGIPTTGLLAQVLVTKYVDHQPLYRQETIFGRAGLAIPRSTLAQWVGTCGVRLQPLVDAMKAQMLKHRVLHADETPVQMLKPVGKSDGKTHRAYLWAYAPGVFENMKAVVYDFCESRAGEHARNFLGDWKGSLVVDDYVGYKQGLTQGLTEVGCLAHARRKFFDLHATNKSLIAEFALKQFAKVYAIEREVKELKPDERRAIRQQQTQPLLDALHQWMTLQRQQVPDGSATAKALDYNLRRWEALTRFAGDGQLPVDNNWIENQIRPIALGRANWLFAGSLRAGQRAAAVMSLIQSARMNRLDPYAYLKDVLSRLPTLKASRIDELLPHRWQPTDI